MINKLASLIGKKFDPVNYHCWHFIEEAMDVPTLEDVHVDHAKDDVQKYLGMFTEMKKPVDYCIVLLGDSHIGIYYQYGVFHNDKNGVRYEEMRVMRMKYTSFKYYKVKT